MSWDGSSQGGSWTTGGGPWTAGISLYLSGGYAANEAVVRKASRAGVRHAFTSLHIPEETGIDYRREVRRLLDLCREAGISLMADVSARTLQKLGCQDFDEVAALGVTHARLDFGFDARQVAALSRSFHVTFNASTVTRSDVVAWRAAGADLSNFAACHNYYPKRLTGLSLERVAHTNARLKELGLQVMAFVPGDATLRGPLHEGLPTIEVHRGDKGDGLARDMLELFSAGCDVVFVGDPDVSKAMWERMDEFGRGYVSLRARLDEGFRYLYGRVQHDRFDSSPYVIRSQESRLWDDTPSPKAPDFGSEGKTCSVGDVIVSNATYGRYSGEVEIARKAFALDARDTVAGHVDERDLTFLPFVCHGAGFRLVRP